MRGVVVRVIMPTEIETTAATSRKPGNGLGMAVVAMVTGMTLLRFLLCGVMELIPEEAYYWTYSKHPALGYFDHPPMIAWTVAIGTTLFGDSALGVRFMTFVLWIASAGLLFLIGRMWFTRRVALMAVLLFTILPIYVGAGLIVTPDGPLLFFWLATLYLISKALHSGRGGYWLLAGVTFGGAMLSKYYAVLIAPSLLWFLLLSPKHRHWLRRPEPWLALPIALAVFSPVIIWNAQHEWASFLFQSTRTAGQQSKALRDVLLFWLVQLAVLTPLLFALLAAAAVRGIRRGWLEHDDRWNFVAWWGDYRARRFRWRKSQMVASGSVGNGSHMCRGHCVRSHKSGIWVSQSLRVRTRWWLASCRATGGCRAGEVARRNRAGTVRGGDGEIQHRGGDGLLFARARSMRQHVCHGRPGIGVSVLDGPAEV